MFPKAQLLLACLVVKAYGLHHHQPSAGYRATGYGGYTAQTAATALRGYADYASPPQPYSFGYDNVDEYGNRQFRSEQGDSSNAKTGSYGYRDAYGLYRRVNYVADANGFRATVDTNEPGTAPGASANAVFNAAPVVPPVPGNAAASRAGFAPTAYGASGVATGYNNAYNGNTGYGYGPYGGAAAGYGRIPYAGNGYTPNGAAVGGYAYGAGAGAYAGGYGSFGYGGANGWAPGYGGYRRR